ncbi:hypothetical protein PHYSODRAFT_532111 [Phytophthora sojae]|uniref:Phospholipid-transporting ATPase n=1 Tax=Phytophthora sojae (strain P6497) TaxID=1094619 RepID=G5AE06_PHYSP|nr:hypothetical protein PHYSODRAFT_532111 [Phytophthora sojae]EGZ06408.1 hypothetical protein PHYSODRAFT_532111 [Phytophthora sojae]|eukprot:XP_009538305.1 hypothetical protein PHYSODRAFT_532111 [Phytophthora sojae]
MEPRAAPQAPAAAVEPRVAFLNDKDANQQLITSKQYARNVMVTSKYTAVSFVPKCIFEFFRVVANVYFLLISVLQLATPWSPTNRFTTAGPLLFVLLVTMVKQGSEDFKRHQADEKQNRRLCRIINTGGQTEMIAWQDLQVGQLVCVENHEELPADVVILATSEEEGRCFIETSNLDGETNLKRRIAVKPTAQLVGWRELHGDGLSQEAVCASAVRRLRGSVEHEQPNNQLYTFTGRLLLNEGGRGETAVPLGPENLLLRGCNLRSCAFIVGLVIFTGSETKLLQNSRAAPSKQSKLYRTANRCMLLIFTTMFALCLASAIAAASWSSHNASRVWYLPFIKEGDGADDFIVNFFTFLILYNNLVPISLYVSLDIIKVLQANRITSDASMVFEGTHAVARTSELNEELGQVEYVFSDKTGTLTCNVMEFRKCSIGGISYGFGTTEIGRAVAALASVKTHATSGASRQTSSPAKAKINPLGFIGEGSGSAVRLDINSTDDIREIISSAGPTHSMIPFEEGGDPKDAQVHFDPSIHFDDPCLLRSLYAGGKQGELINEFLTLLSICHTVIPETDSKTGAVTYRASSPDEEALVKAAKCLGYNFVAPAPLMKVEISRKQSLLPPHLTPQYKPEPTNKCFTIVNVNEFNSTRKRMSVVAVNEETHEYILYCKGADNMMLERAATGQNDGDAADHAKLVGHLKNYAREGLRTLVLGRRVLTEGEYKEYNKAYIEASTSLEDREAKLDACAELVERNMQLLGVTAIEDKLQDGVPSAIFDLAQAGIKVWVLTGDREETAINIGHACRLINDKMQLLYVNAERIDALSAQLDALHETPEIQRLIRSEQVAENLAMVCDGKALVHIFPSRDTRVKMSAEAVERVKLLSEKLLDIARKAEIVQLVRKGGRPGNKAQQPITLAIGDGANDVSMIQTAHVGVGICGKEGVQAVNASDYAVAQFRFLTRLVLLHGRCNYKRVCKVIRYSFYKNIALVISLFVFNFFNGQSGAPLFESFVMAGWNFFLALPIIVIGVFDQDIPEDVVLKFPQLYRRGQFDSDLNMRVFARTIINSVGHALICFFGCYAGTLLASQGLYVLGTLFYTALLGTMKLKVVLLSLNWNKYHFAVMTFSIWLFIFFLLVYPHFTFMSYDMYGVPSHMIRIQRYWTLLLLCPVAAMTIDFTATAAQQQFRPTAEDILRERFRSNKSKRVGDSVAPMAPTHESSSPSIDRLFLAGQSIDEDNKSDSKGSKDGKPTAFAVTAQPPSSNRRTGSSNSLPLYDSFKASLPQPEARTSFAFNGLDEPSRRHASGDLPAQEAVTMRVLSFQRTRRPSRSSSLSRLPAVVVAPELASSSRRDNS